MAVRGKSMYKDSEVQRSLGKCERSVRMDHLGSQAEEAGMSDMIKNLKTWL